MESKKYSAILKELNISIESANAALQSVGLFDLPKRNALVSEEQYNVLLEAFPDTILPSAIQILQKRLELRPWKVDLIDLNRFRIGTTLPYTTNDEGVVIGVGITDSSYKEIPEALDLLKDSLRFLSLSGNNISSLERLSDFVHLEELRVAFNDVTRISGLERLSKLRVLDIGNNQLDRITGLEHLTNLELLKLQGNAIVEISNLEGLSKLKELNLSFNSISELKGLQGLTELNVLDLTNNKIDSLHGLSHLTKLTSLELSGNRMSQISNLVELKKLRFLDLRGNSIQDLQGLKGLKELVDLNLESNLIEDIKPIASLKQLEVIYLKNNKIDDIQSLEGLEHLRSLEIDDNPFETKEKYNDLKIKGLEGAEQLEQVKYWFSIRDKGKEGINLPTKILLLGNSNVGKTCLKKYLIGDQGYCDKHDSTHIAEVTEWEYKPNQKAFIWDFGGQDYYHSVHHLFFTLSSLYVVAYDSEDANIFSEEDMHYNFKVNYWLENLNYIAPDKSDIEDASEKGMKTIMLVENKIDQESDNVIEISDKFNIKEKYRISLCPPNKEIRPEFYDRRLSFLRDEIIFELENLSQAMDFQIASFLKIIVEKIIDETFGEKDRFYYTRKDFLALCQSYEPQIKDGDLEYLLLNLKNSGLVLYFSDMVNDVWMYPKDLIATIHDNLKLEVIKKEYGRLTRNKISFLKKDNLLPLLEKQEVIFKDAYDNRYIFPQYLQVKHDENTLYEIAKANLDMAFSLRFEDFLPSAFMSRVICRFGKKTEQKYYGRYEIIFTETIENQLIRVWIKTDLEQMLVKVFVSEFHSKINKDEYLAYLFKALIICYNGKESHINYEDYRNAADEQLSFNRDSNASTSKRLTVKKGSATFTSKYWNFGSINFPEDLHIIINNNEVKYSHLLQSDISDNFIYSSDNNRVHKSKFSAIAGINFKRPSKVFISYAHRDFSYLERLEAHLAGLRHQGYVEDWSDTKIQMGDRWDDKIKSKLEDADIVILLISADFINSSYIHNTEIPLIKSKEEQGNCKVLPVIVEDCDWETLKFSSEIQAYPYYKTDDGALQTVRPLLEFEHHSKAYKQIVSLLRNYVTDGIWGVK